MSGHSNWTVEVLLVKFSEDLARIRDACPEECSSKTGRGDEPWDDTDLLRVFFASELNHDKAVEMFRAIVDTRVKLGLPEIHKRYKGVPWREIPHWETLNRLFPCWALGGILRDGHTPVQILQGKAVSEQLDEFLALPDE